MEAPFQSHACALHVRHATVAPVREKFFLGTLGFPLCYIVHLASHWLVLNLPTYTCQQHEASTCAQTLSCNGPWHVFDSVAQESHC
jgi:hypothetical protein